MTLKKKKKSKATLTQNIEPSGKLSYKLAGQQEMPIIQQAIKKKGWQECSGKTIYVTVLRLEKQTAALSASRIRYKSSQVFNQNGNK